MTSPRELGSCGAWLADRPTVVAPIASVRRVQRPPALLGVGEVVPADAETERLTTASA
ncbi:hypothetical protein [Streptomyces sp. NPDC058735]|uniref:hypothetical protein n=1 Tax=unclassified Streptomyces TaxID=2593676 RepID=UPI003683909A